MNESKMTCLRVQEQTVGDDRIRIRHWSDGTKSILYLARGAVVRRGKPIFGVVSTVDVPPAMVDFVSDAFGLLPAPCRCGGIIVADAFVHAESCKRRR